MMTILLDSEHEVQNMIAQVTKIIDEGERCVHGFFFQELNRRNREAEETNPIDRIF